ncbi:MAG: hypothetical protein NT145_03515 [Elusimicrobia bacterium]|nr:hypothetical protein [Elusimicrobiota bacterium]
MEKYSISFLIGMALLILNPVIGWGAVIFAVYLYKKSKNKIYLLIGTITYILSWGMLFLGSILAGRQGFKLLKTFVKENILLTSLAAIIILVIYLLNQKRKNKTGNEIHQN